MNDMFYVILVTCKTLENLEKYVIQYADPVADILDKRRIFSARLFREACVYYEGNYVKDLNKLGRDLRKVIIIDNSRMFFPCLTL